jgi:hypothetical protein
MGESVMVDLETWGTTPGSALRSIGACTFVPATGETPQTFYRNITRESCEAVGLLVDPETEKWWADQSEEARKALEPDQLPLTTVLLDFFKWWDAVGGEHIWSHGANFDEVLLKSAIAAVGLDSPWAFWNVRCCRTVLALNNRRPLRDKGTHHNALDDAVAQAVAVSAALRQGIRL